MNIADHDRSPWHLSLDPAAGEDLLGRYGDRQPGTRRRPPGEVLERHGAEFLSVGGVAPRAYGAARLTGDFDCVVRRATENRHRLTAAVREREGGRSKRNLFPRRNTNWALGGR